MTKKEKRKKEKEKEKKKNSVGISQLIVGYEGLGRR